MENEMADEMNARRSYISGFTYKRVALVCTVIAVPVFCVAMSGRHCKSNAKLDGKTVLITGANTGIGKETARNLAKRGARVLLACRNISKAEATADEIRKDTGNPDVVVYKLDLASLTSIRQCASDVIAKETHLDVLINNAGIAYTPYMKTEDGFEMQFGTNHLGHFLLTNLLLNLLKKSAPSRIINVSSKTHKYASALEFETLNSENNYNPITAYCNSKLCNNLFTHELSKRMKGSGVTVNSLHPGVVATEMMRYAESETFNIVLRSVWKALYYGMLQYVLKTPVEGAQTTICCAVDPELEGITGKYFSECAIDTESPAATDATAAAKLWSMSEAMVGGIEQPNKPFMPQDDE